jgi:hypothetical protein
MGAQQPGHTLARTSLPGKPTHAITVCPSLILLLDECMGARANHRNRGGRRERCCYEERKRR